MQNEWGSYSFSSLFILDVATESQKDHKLFSATYILCNKKIGDKKIKVPHSLTVSIFCRRNGMCANVSPMKIVIVFKVFRRITFLHAKRS